MPEQVEVRGGAGVRLRKRLSANDVGATGSHQAGVFVPPSMIGFFPGLDEDGLNPDAWITVEDTDGHSWLWRFLHYNNAVVRTGTRNEYRLTHTTQALRELGARTGDELELERLEDRLYRVRLVAIQTHSRVLVLSTAGPWRTVSIRIS
jgi:hypothetical protein